MRRLLALLPAVLVAWPLDAATHAVILRGLGGEPRYEERFAEEAERLAAALRRSAGDDSLVRKLEADAARRRNIQATFRELSERLEESDSLAVILIGHGSWDGDDYKFNIPGPDVTATELAEMLDGVAAQRQLIVNTTSSSGAALETLRGERKRLVITATKSGRERTATFFSKYWAAAFDDPAADLNKNETISAEEAFRYAEAKVKDFFESGNLLATEHPMIAGEQAGGFVLARLGAAAEVARDPALRPLLDRRDEIETRIEQLKLRKDALGEDEYFSQLQSLLIDLAELQEEIAAKTGEADVEKNDP